MRMVLVTISLLASTPALAAGWSTADRSVAAMGSGGAAVARADDPGANAYNPAAGATLPGLHASIGALVAAPSLSAEGSGWSAATAGGASVPPHLHLRWAGETLAFGASVTIPFGSAVRWPEAWERRYDLIEANLRVVRTSAFAAYRVGDFSFAAGPFIDAGSLSLVRAIDFIEAEGRTSIETHATGFGLVAAAFWQASGVLDLGLSYQSRSSLSLTGFADFTVPPELRGRASDQAVTAELTLPDRITLGALFRATETVELNVDLEVLAWSTVDELHLDFAGEDMTDVRQPRDWRATVTPRAGASWLALDWLKVRGGIFFDPSPVPVETLGPSSPDSSRIGLTLGAGAELVKNLSLDAGYQLLLFTGATTAGESTGGVSYAGTAHLAGLSISYRAEL